MPDSPFLVGIDLGTTNSAVAFVDTRRRAARVQRLVIPQLTEPSLVAARPVLPSFLYFGEPHEIESGVLALPWNPKPDAIVGVLARERGALAPARQVTSAKSWLAHPGVDRRAAILPWGADSGFHISPVDASAHYLSHIRDAWNASVGRGDGLRFERQSIVLTVPASFDEEARELTVEAARRAGFERLTLLEEPIAAFYAWAATARPGRPGGPGSERLRPYRAEDRELRGEVSASVRAGGGAPAPVEESGAGGERLLPRLTTDDSRLATAQQIALVCDVGGGTSDFSLIRVRTVAGLPEFERIAVGDHLLLGGDNVDLALATLVERRMAESRRDFRLVITQRAALRRLCAAAKERLLGGTETPPDRIAITVLGSGRAVIGAATTADLTRQDVLQVLQEFLPLTPPGEIAAMRDRRAGLRELGLPYESDPAITRHLAGFLARSAEAVRPAGDPDIVVVGGRPMVRPDLLLFNGGFFTPAAARERIVEALAAWFGEAPAVLRTGSLEAAVAMGAAIYARLRAGVGPSMSMVKAGSGRAYYVGLRGPRTGETIPAVCVLARGTDEGTTGRLDHPFTIITNRPVSFALYSSVVRSDHAGDLVSLSPGDDVREHAPLVTVLRYGRKSRQVDLPVRLSITFTELGTLELWCESQVSEHRWRLQFQLRNRDAELFDDEGSLPGAAGAHELDRRVPPVGSMSGIETDAGADARVSEAGDASAAADPDAANVVVPDAAIETAERAIRCVFESGGGDVTAENLVAHLEQILGFDKMSWPLPLLRLLADALISVSAGRRASPAREARWLNLFGFCFRPGFGAAKDPWRSSEARAIYTAGLIFPNATQNRVEWIVLWQRVAGGFSAGQQRELAQRLMGELGLLGRKAARLNPQVERESWRLLASLERLDPGTRTRIGDELLTRIRRDARNASLLWAIGRLGARAPLYGPLSSIVQPHTAARWLDVLASSKLTTPELAAAMVQIGARTGDALRDLDSGVLAAVRRRLRDAGIADEALRQLDVVLPSSTAEMHRVFGEPLPDGLQLQARVEPEAARPEA